MIRARHLLLLLSVAIAPVLASCASRSIPGATQIAPVAQSLAPTQTAVSPLKKQTLTGSWHGSWQSSSGSGGFTMKLTQKRKTFSGTFSVTISGSTESGSVKGTIRKEKLSLSVSQKILGSGKGTATTNKTRTTMKGSTTFSKFEAISFSASKG